MKVKTLGAQEDFIVQINGDYNVPFDEVVVGIDVEAGDVLEDASTLADGDSETVLGIVAADAEAGESVRVMVRGNPTTVNAQAISFSTGAVEEALAAKNIIVVNK